MTTEPEAVARLPRWLYAVLIASLAVNLLFIGGVGAAYWHHRGHGHGRGDDFGMMGFARDLPPERQKLVRDQVTVTREAMRPLRRALRDAWADSNKVLTAEPFDKEALKAAMARQAEAEGKFKTAISAMFADTAEKLLPEERRQLQAWREKHKSRMFGRHGRGDDGGPGSEGPGGGPPGKDDQER